MVKCWNCGGQMHQAIGLGLGWFQCSSCGATWIKMPKLGIKALMLKKNPATGLREYSPKLRKRVKKVKK